MYGRLIVLNKQPGVCPVGVGETWQRFFAKYVMRAKGRKDTNACQDDHLCAVLNAVIDGRTWGSIYLGL